MAALKCPQRNVTREYDISLNAVAVELNGTPLATIAAAPMVQAPVQRPLPSQLEPELQDHQRGGCLDMLPVAEPPPAPASRSGHRHPVSTRHIRSSILLASATPRASRSAMQRTAIRTTKTRTASTSPRKSSSPKSSTTELNQKASTRRRFRTTGPTPLASRPA